jgi:hypothetical protein
MLSLLLLLTILISHGAYAFDLTSSDSARRSVICTEQRAYCSSYCGLPTNVKINFCDTTSMKWNCACHNPMQATHPGATDSQFPVQVHQCQGEKWQCKQQCLSASEVGTCQDQCELKYLCGYPTGGESKSYRIQGDGSDIVNNDKKNAIGTEESAASHGERSAVAMAMAVVAMAVVVAMMTVAI